MKAAWLMMNGRLKATLRRLEGSEWFDLYHLHPSLYGYGKRDLRLLCTIEVMAREVLARRFRQHQCFIIIDMANSDYDAVFLHTKNGNQTTFPLHFARGVVTRNVPRYRQIMVSLEHTGYVCHKIKGRPSVIAVHREAEMSPTAR